MSATANTTANGIRNYRDVKSLTISGDPNPNHVAATATITITDVTSLANGHTFVLRDGYNQSTTFTINTTNNTTTGNNVGILTGFLGGDVSIICQQFKNAINDSAGEFSAVNGEDTVTITQNITWAKNFGNTIVAGEAVGTGLAANSTSNGSGGDATGFTLSNFSGGKEARASLKINQKQLAGIGSFSYIASLRKSILESRTGMATSATPLKFRTPSDWDLDWHHRLGPIWTPESCTSSVKTWLQSTQHLLDTTNFNQVNQLTDLSDEGHNYVQLTSANRPVIGTPTPSYNNFYGLTFDGSNDALYNNSYGSDYDASTSDDFGCFIVIKTGLDLGTTQFILQMGSAGANGSLGISLDTSSTNTTLNVITRNGGTLQTNSYVTAFDHNSFTIIFVGRVDGSQAVRVNGTAKSSLSVGGWQNIAPGGTDSVIGETYSGLSSTNGFKGNFYEFIYLTETSSNQIQNDYQKIEGYLAHKYGQISVLPNDHPYKNEAPRATLSL